MSRVLSQLNDVVKSPQILSAGNTTVLTNTAGTFTGVWEHTRSVGVVRALTVLASTVTTGLGGTFTFQFSEDGTTPTINEVRTVTDFSAVRDFDLINYGEFYRALFTPSRALTGAEFVFVTTQYATGFDGPFVRLANQQIEEANAAMGQAFSYVKGFDPITGNSVNIRPTPNEALRVSDDKLYVTPSGSAFFESIRDDISHKFTSTDVAAELLLLQNYSTGGTATADTTNGLALFSTGATPGNSAVFFSQKNAIYETGHGIVGEQTISLSALPTGNAYVEWGYASTDLLNGSGFGADATGTYTWRRKNGVYEQKTRQSAWNRDKANGQVPSLYKRGGVPVALSVTADALYRVQYEWLGADNHVYLLKAPSGAFLEANVEEYLDTAIGSTLPTPVLPLHIAVHNDTTVGGNLTARSGSWRGGIFTSKAAGTGKNPNGDYADNRVQGNDPGNTNNTPLAAGGIYRGTWFAWQGSYLKLITDMKSDVPGTLFIDFSEQTTPVNGDDSSIDDSIMLTYDPTVLRLLRRQTPVQARWYRHRYVNGVAGQSVFLLDAALMVSDPGMVTQALIAVPLVSTEAGIVRNVPAVGDGTGLAYHEQPVDTSGVPTMHVTRVDDDLLLRGLTSSQVHQYVVGTTPVRLDASPLAGRRYAGIANLDESTTPVTVYIGHSAAIANDSGTFPVYSKGEKGGAYGPNVPIWAVCKNTGGVQTVLARSASTSTGTATNPTNALVSDNAYATMAQGQTLDLSGFTAGTANTLVSVKLCVEANKQAGQTETVAFVDVATGAAGNVGTVATSSNVVAAPLMTYLAYVSRESAATVTGVTGLGLTWTQVRTQASDDAHRTLDVWIAQGSPSTSGVVTASFSIAATGSHVAVLRLSGVDMTTPVQASAGGAANSTAVAVGALAGTNKGLAVLGAAQSTATSTPGAGYTERSEQVATDGLSTDTKALTATGSESPTATLSASKHYAAIGVTLTPAASYDPQVTLSYTLSGVPGVTSGLVDVNASADVVTKIDVTSDRTWTAADVPNVHILAAGTVVSGALADVDQIYLEVTDTTANQVRVAFREIA